MKAVVILLLEAAFSVAAGLFLLAQPSMLMQHLGLVMLAAPVPVAVASLFGKRQ